MVIDVELYMAGQMNSDCVQLSVVVIGRNEGSRLLTCLESIEKLHLSGFRIEVIYVDSASTDGSSSLAQSKGARLVELREGPFTAARARNAGWRIAQAPFILFLDGDTILQEGFVWCALAHFDDPSIAVVWGHRREVNPTGSIYNRVLDLDWVSPTGFTKVCGGDALIRRAALAEVGGYDASLIAGEEPELCQRLAKGNYRILHIDRLMTLHDLAIMEFSQYWKRSIRTGYAFAEVSSRGLPQEFWKKESRYNLRRSAMYGTFFAVGLVASFSFQSVFPLLLCFAAFLAICLRTGLRRPLRSPSILTCLLFGIHSHVQHLPICLGQLSFFLFHRTDQPRQLIEYK
jgi:glycosyltransferase involved in cell wall biosynthesis